MNVSRKTIGGIIVAACAFSIMLLCSYFSVDHAQKEEFKPAHTAEGYVLAKEGTLTVASSLSRQPYEYATNYKAEGFAYDVLEATANKLGLRCEVSQVPDEKIGAVLDSAGTADVGLCSSAAAPSPAQGSIKLQPYMRTSRCVVLRNDVSYDSLTQLSNPVILVDSDAFSDQSTQDWLASNFPQGDIQEAEKARDCFSGLKSGIADAAIMDAPYAQYYTRYMYADCIVASDLPLDVSLCATVGSKNQTLARDLDGALASLKESEEYDTIYERWFGSLVHTDDKNASTPALAAE